MVDIDHIRTLVVRTVRIGQVCRRFGGCKFGRAFLQRFPNDILCFEEEYLLYRISTDARKHAQHTHPSAKRMISSELYAVAEYLMLSNSSQQDSSASQARLTDSADTAVERFARGPVSALLIKRQAS
jgi:hypothetical protein